MYIFTRWKSSSHSAARVHNNSILQPRSRAPASEIPAASLKVHCKSCNKQTIWVQDMKTTAMHLQQQQRNNKQTSWLINGNNHWVAEMDKLRSWKGTITSAKSWAQVNYIDIHIRQNWIQTPPHYPKRCNHHSHNAYEIGWKFCHCPTAHADTIQQFAFVSGQKYNRSFSKQI